MIGGIASPNSSYFSLTGNLFFVLVVIITVGNDGLLAATLADTAADVSQKSAGTPTRLKLTQTPFLDKDRDAFQKQVSFASGASPSTNPTHPPKFSVSNCPLCQSKDAPEFCWSDPRDSLICPDQQSCWEYSIGNLVDSETEVVYKCSEEGTAHIGCEEGQCAARELLEDLSTTPPTHILIADLTQTCIPECQGGLYCFRKSYKDGLKQDYECADGEEGPEGCLSRNGCSSCMLEISCNDVISSPTLTSETQPQPTQNHTDKQTKETEQLKSGAEFTSRNFDLFIVIVLMILVFMF